MDRGQSSIDLHKTPLPSTADPMTEVLTQGFHKLPSYGEIILKSEILKKPPEGRNRIFYRNS